MSDIAIVVSFLAIIFVLFFIYLFWREGKKKRQKKEEETVKAQAGARGEKSVEDALEKGLSEKYIFRDIVIDYKDFTHEIDFLVVTRAGLSVVEVKNWAPQVYGNIEDSEWTQVNVKTKERHSYKNPLKQNDGHVEAVRAIAPHNTPIYAYTVFVRGQVIGDAKDLVITPKRLVSEINSQRDVLSGRKAFKLSRRIAQSRSLTTRGQHITRIKQTYQGEQYF